MVIDIDKEVETFRGELKTKKFSLDNLDNNEVFYNTEKSERDLAAFDDFLRSDIFKTLDKEASS
jgi:hypothetical protein